MDAKKLGKFYSNGIRLQIRPGKYRVPDIVFLHKDNFHARHNRAWLGADLVMEVVSDGPQDQQRDYQEKLADYAEGGVGEYWMVDYVRKSVIEHQLNSGEYIVRGEYGLQQQAVSELLEGFSIDVTALFTSAADIPD